MAEQDSCAGGSLPFGGKGSICITQMRPLLQYLKPVLTLDNCGKREYVMIEGARRKILDPEV